MQYQITLYAKKMKRDGNLGNTILYLSCLDTNLKVSSLSLTIAIIFSVQKQCNSTKKGTACAKEWYPASRGHFSIVFAELTGTRKRYLCPGSKRTLIQPPSEVVDSAYKTHAPCIVCSYSAVI